MGSNVSSKSLRLGAFGWDTWRSTSWATDGFSQVLENASTQSWAVGLWFWRLWEFGWAGGVSTLTDSGHVGDKAFSLLLSLPVVGVFERWAPHQLKP